jgi:hypothetical protein
VWIKHGNGNIVLVVDAAHITRLLKEEGGQECADPRQAVQETVQQEEPIDIHRQVTKPKRPIKKAR